MFRACPSADVLYAMDPQWWNVYLPEVLDVFEGALYSSNHSSAEIGPVRVMPQGWYNGGHSGAGALSLALTAGAAVVYLLGYDGQYDGQRRHSHGDHPHGLGNAGSVGQWQQPMQRLAEQARALGTRVYNCSPRSVHTCFERMPVEVALCQ